MKKYICSPLSDMATLFDNAFGANFTRAVISAEKPKTSEWIQPFFSCRTDALIFQDILIGRLSIDDSSVDKLETELMTSDMYYSISLAVLNKLRQDTEAFLAESASQMKLEGSECTLLICGLGNAGVPLLYNGFNQSMNTTEIVQYLNSLQIDDPATLKLYLTSNASAASKQYTFASMEQLRDQFQQSLESQNAFLLLKIGTQGSLAAELSKSLLKKEPAGKYDFSTTEVYGYLFPCLTQGIESYGVDPEKKCLTDYKSLSMTAVTSVFTKDGQYYQQIPVRRSLTKVKITSTLG